MTRIEGVEDANKLRNMSRMRAGQPALTIMIAPPCQNLDLGAGFPIWFSQKSGISRGAADVLPEAQERKFLLAFPSNAGEDEPLPDYYGRRLYVTAEVKW